MLGTCGWERRQLLLDGDDRHRVARVELTEKAALGPGAAADLAPTAERLTQHHEPCLRHLAELPPHLWAGSQHDVKLAGPTGGRQERTPRLFAERLLGFVKQE